MNKKLFIIVMLIFFFIVSQFTHALQLEDIDRLSSINKVEDNDKDEIELNLKRGDIVWRYVDEDIFPLFSFLMHPMMYTGRTRDMGSDICYEFVESNGGKGVCYSLTTKNGIFNCSSLFDYIYRVKGASAQQVENAISFAEEQVGSDFVPIYEKPIKEYKPTRDPTWYCTELVWASYFNCDFHPSRHIYGQGIDIDANRGLIITPQDIHNSPNIIKEPLFLKSNSYPPEFYDSPIKKIIKRYPVMAPIFRKIEEIEKNPFNLVDEPVEQIDPFDPVDDGNPVSDDPLDNANPLDDSNPVDDDSSNENPVDDSNPVDDGNYEGNPVDDDPVSNPAPGDDGVNYAPVFVDIANVMYVDEGDVLYFEVFASDSDGDDLSFSVVSGPGSFSGNDEGSTVYYSQSGSVVSDWYIFVAPVDDDCDDEMFYDVTLSVSDGIFSDAMSFNIVVNDDDVCNSVPDAGISGPSAGLIDEQLIYYSDSDDLDGYIIYYEWEKFNGLFWQQVGSGSSKTSVTVSFDNDVGAKKIKLTVTDNDGAMDTVIKTVDVSAGSNPSPC